MLENPYDNCSSVSARFFEPLWDEQKVYELAGKGMKGNSFTGIGVTLGAGIGAAIGAAMDNIGLWIAIGVALGVAVGAGLDSQRSKKDE